MTLVLPFARPPQALARDLLSQLKMPALAKLLSRARLAQRTESRNFDACLPHERWLCGHDHDNSPPVAHALMKTLGGELPSGSWFVIQPVHLHVARDHLVLTDYRRLSLSHDEARIWFESVQPLFTEQHLQLVYGNAHYWFVHAERWSDFRTCTPDVTCGHNIDVWQPDGRCAREWRRLHNEVQMLWHQHPLNQQRESLGEPPINALWLWGMSSGGEMNAGHCLLARSLTSIPNGIPDTTENERTLIHGLQPPALAEDWAGWLQQMQLMEQAYFAPALERLSCGGLDEIRLVLSDAHRLDVWSARRSGMRKFWIAPSLSRLTS